MDERLGQLALLAALAEQRATLLVDLVQQCGAAIGSQRVPILRSALLVTQADTDATMDPRIVALPRSTLPLLR